jgi:hypothetical protein
MDNHNNKRNNCYRDIGIEKLNEKNSKQRQNILHLNDKINEMEEQLTNSKRIKLSNESQSSLNYEKEALNAAQQKINEQNAFIHKLKEKNIELEIGLSSLELLKSASSELDTKNKLIDKLNLKIIDLNQNLQDARSQMELLTNENLSIKKDLEIKTQTSIVNFRNFACTNSEINLKLKNENLKLTADLDALKLKINNQQDLAQYQNQNEAISKLELMTSTKDNEINLLKEQNKKLKTENELVKNTNKEAYSCARHYVDKLKEFEQNLIKERLERLKNNRREQEGIYLFIYS